jgi:hypothetical protein
MDFSNSVILPREDFVELQEAAWSQTPTSAGDRAANTAQTAVVLLLCSGAVTLGAWGWYKAMNWYDEQDLKRALKNPKYKNSPAL